jgi:hypothetical protein
MYAFAKIAVTKYGGQEGLTNRKIFCSSSGGWNLRKAVNKVGFFSDVSPWLTDVCLLPAFLHGPSPMCVCVFISSSYKDISHTGKGLPP